MGLTRPAAAAVLLLALAFAFNFPEAECQGGAVRGRVYARDYLGDYVPVGFATIIVRSEFFETYTRTDTDGYYIIYLPAGTYNMTAVFSTVTLDYVKSNTVTVWQGSDTTINFYLGTVITSRLQQVSVAISVDGVPSRYSVDLKVDDSSAGPIPGGGTVKVEVDWRVGHTFSVQPYVYGSKGERFHCSADSWYLEEFSHPTQEAKVANTFHYTTQYLLSVSTPHGDAAKNSGWYDKDSSVSLHTPEVGDISEGERDIFDGWAITGFESKDPDVSVMLDSPVDAKAEYHREYYLQVRSEYGNPSGSGWHIEGSTVTVQVERNLSLEGLLGALGGRRVFVGWSGGVSSNNNIVDVNIDSPKTLVADWREDYSILHVIIIALTVTVIVAVFAKSRRSQDR